MHLTRRRALLTGPTTAIWPRPARAPAPALSWMPGFLPRADKLNKRSCPYNEALRAKPLREALVASFTAAPVRGIVAQVGRAAA